MRRLLLVAVLALLLPPTDASPQERLPVSAGDQVRVWSPAYALSAQSATVDSVGEQVLVLRIPRSTFPVSIAVDSLTRLDVRVPGEGSVVEGALGGGLLGTLVAVAAGWGAAYIGIFNENTSWIPILVVPPLGTLLGATIGASLSQRQGHRWTTVLLRDR